MSEWKSVNFNDISKQKKGINYKSEDYSDEDLGHPFITIKCFQKGGGYDPTGIKFYDGFCTKSDHLNPGDILFSVTDLTRAGDIVGSPLRVPDFRSDKPALASMDCMLIEPITDKCDKAFLYHRMMLYQLCMKTFLQILSYTRPFKRIQDKLPVDYRHERGLPRACDDGIDAALQVGDRLKYLPGYRPFRPGPDLLYRVHFRAVRGLVEQHHIVRQLQPGGGVEPCIVHLHHMEVGGVLFRKPVKERLEPVGVHPLPFAEEVFPRPDLDRAVQGIPLAGAFGLHPRPDPAAGDAPAQHRPQAEVAFVLDPVADAGVPGKAGLGDLGQRLGEFF